MNVQADRQTDRQTDRQLDKFINFRVPLGSPQLIKVQGNYFVSVFRLSYLGLVDVTNLSYLMMII